MPDLPAEPHEKRYKGAVQILLGTLNGGNQEVDGVDGDGSAGDRFGNVLEAGDIGGAAHLMFDDHRLMFKNGFE